MKKVVYRQFNKGDTEIVKKMVDDAFGLHNYIDNKSVLDSVLSSYVQSCLAEATYTCLAEKNGKIIGVIMGKSDCDYKILPHVKSTMAFWYHNICVNIKSYFMKCDNSDYKKIHEIYHKFITNCQQSFDGVLTLFVVTEESRGLGVGKELLNLLFAYYNRNDVNNIYLYTDTSCNFGFYEHQGFKRLMEEEMQITSNHKKKPFGVYLYGYKLKNIS